MLKQKREAEYRNERGRFSSFVLWSGWTIFIGFVAWYVTQWLLFESGVMTLETLYRDGFPRSLPEENLIYIVTGIVFILINMFIMIGYFLALPSGRRRADQPTTFSRRPDFYR